MENFTAINYHETRDFSKKVSVTFEYIRQNFKSLGKSIVFIAGPPVLIASLFMGSFFSDFMTATMSAGQGRDAEMLQNLFLSTTFWLQVGLMMMFFVLSTVVTVATINNYLLLYEQKGTNKIDVADVWARVRDTFWMYLGTTILFYLLAIAAYLVLVFVIIGIGLVSEVLVVFVAIAIGCAFIYFVVASSLIYVVRAYENVGFFEGIFRSLQLVKGKWWSTFGIIFVLYLIAVTVSYIFMVPGYIMTFVSALHSLEAGEASQASNAGGLVAIFFTLYYLAQMLLYTLPHLGIAFQYFNLVERKEARGLITQIETIGQQPTQSSADEHY